MQMRSGALLHVDNDLMRSVANSVSMSVPITTKVITI